MMKVLFLSVLVSVVVASPLPDAPKKPWTSPSGQTVIPYLAEFEDKPAGVLANAPTRGLTPLGAYDNLYFDNLNVILNSDTLLGVRPQSAPNVLAYDAVARLGGQQRMLADYDGSITDFFAFKSFYLGCGLDTEESASSVPTSCDVVVTGRKNSVTVTTQTASFKAVLPNSTMQKITLNSGFTDVDEVLFQTQGALKAALFAVLLDNLEYDVYLKAGTGETLP